MNPPEKSSGYRDRIYANYASQFQGAGDRFDAAAARQWGRAYDYYLREWLPSDKNADIADLACGYGRLLYYFKERGFMRLQGIDCSASQVALARQVVPDVAEGSALDFLKSRPSAFDLITAFDILEHLHKDEALRFLDSSLLALKPGGRLILQTPNAESPWSGNLRYADFTHEISFTAHSLGRLLALCGFEHIQAREQGPVPWGYSFKSTARYVAWQGIRAGLCAWNMVETGNVGSGVFTRVYLMSARKP